MKVVIEKAALDALLKSAVPVNEGSTQAIAEERNLDVRPAIRGRRSRVAPRAGRKQLIGKRRPRWHGDIENGTSTWLH